MALVRSIDEATKLRTTGHAPVECTCTIFEFAGQRYLQASIRSGLLEELKNKMSQALQFDRTGWTLRMLIEKAFPEDE